MKGNNLRMSINRTPSLNDLISGKQVAKTLPENFFEQVVDLELKLAKEYKMSTIQELTILFKQAIEYYESIGDPKFKDYTNRLNFLLTDPKLLKSINRNIPSQHKSPISNRDYIRRKSQNIAVKVNINEHEHENTVNKFMNDAKESTLSSKLIHSDLTKQSDNFKMRLEEKRKNKVSSSFILEDCETPISLNKSGNLFESDNKSQNIDINDNDIIINIMGSPKGFGRDLKENHTPREVSNFELTLERKKSVLNLNENNLKNNKIVYDIKNKVNEFLSEFNNYFSEKIFNKYTSHIENLMNEKYKKHLEICNYYDSQIKEMEFLLVEQDCEELHRDSLSEIINNLKSEKQNSLEKNEESFKIMIKESYAKFQNIGFKNNKHVKKFEEKFKIQIYHIVNRILKTDD